MTFDEISALRDVMSRSLLARSPAVVATLVAREGHSYRDPGAMMLMTEALELVGGVSGGCLEEYIGRVGRELLRERDSLLLSFDTAAEVPGQPMPGCGGRLEILVERARPDHLTYLDAVSHAMQASDRAVTLCQFNAEGAWPDPQRCRAVLVDGRITYGDPALVEPIESPAGEALALRECITWRGGEFSQTASYLWPQPRLVIFGARDDAMPLVDIARTASWHVTVVDRRARLATPTRFPRADCVIAETWSRAIGSIAWTPWTSAVVMTHSLEDDEVLLPQLLSLDLEYLGLLGPSARTQRLWKSIPSEDRERIRSPVGLSLGDKSPPAVAVAILAELIANRRGRRVLMPAAAPTPARAAVP